MPNWQDVCWNHGAADAAIGALNRVASELERLAGERVRMAHSLLAEWRGKRRNEFDQRMRQFDHEDATLAQDLRWAAQEVARLSEMAREEQARRERERAEWEAEQERESREEVMLGVI